MYDFILETRMLVFIQFTTVYPLEQWCSTFDRRKKFLRPATSLLLLLFVLL